MGITYIQLMPVTNFGSVDENYPLIRYNWGYDLVQYRVLEDSFSTESANPYGRMFELTKLIKEYHRQGICVNLDVVFSHVYDKGAHTFESTVLDYYFQMNENGNFPNSTYCGNDVGSCGNVCHKYIMNACTYPIRTYHISDFRSSLMGVLDVATIDAVYEARKILNPDFMAYGEGWDASNFLDSEKHTSISNNAQMPYVAHFSNRFRDVVKGRMNTNEVSVKSYCTGTVYLLSTTKDCLNDSCVNIGTGPMFTHPRSAINHVEYYDSMTPWDKLRECCKEDSKKARTTRARVLIAVILLAQGIPFIHSGQKSARSKHRLPSTYEENGGINKLDYLRRNQYRGMVEVTKDLIRIHKEHPILRYFIKENMEQHVSFSDIAQEALLYKIGDKHDGMMITFSPTRECFSYEFEAVYPLLYYNGASEGVLIRKVNIEPYSTIVFS